MKSRIHLYAFNAIFPLLGCFMHILQKQSLLSNPVNIRVANNNKIFNLSFKSNSIITRIGNSSIKGIKTKFIFLILLKKA